MRPNLLVALPVLIGLGLAPFGCKKDPAATTPAASSSSAKSTDGTKPPNDKVTDAKAYTVDQVCSQFVQLYETKLLNGPGKVDPDVHKKSVDDCTTDATKTQSDNPAKFQCIGACAMAATDTEVAQHCRKRCETDPDKFCQGIFEEIDDDNVIGDDEAKAVARCAKSVKEAANDAERTCRRDCVNAAKNPPDFYKCSDATCPAK